MTEPIALGQPTVGEAELAAVAGCSPVGVAGGGGADLRGVRAAVRRVCGRRARPGHEQLQRRAAPGPAGARGRARATRSSWPTTPSRRPATRCCSPAPPRSSPTCAPDIWTRRPGRRSRPLITARTVGIMAVDAFGQSADYDELRAIADRHGLFLVEDAACAAGATYHGRPAGSLADVGGFSFHGRKGITAGEGGVVTTDDDDVAAPPARLHSLRRRVGAVPGRVRRTCRPVVRRARLQLQAVRHRSAAIMLAQLDRLPDLVARRRQVRADRYDELLGDVELVALPRDGHGPGAPLAVLRAHAATLASTVAPSRSALREPRHRLQLRHLRLAPAAGLRPTRTRCPVSADLFARHLAIPMHANLTDGAGRTGRRRRPRGRRAAPTCAPDPPRRRPAPAARRNDHGREPHRLRHRRRRLHRHARRAPAAGAGLPGPDLRLHGPRRPRRR